MRLLAEAQELQFPMGLMENNRCRGFIEFARFDPHQPIHHMVDAAHAVFTADLVQLLNQAHAVSRITIESYRNAVFEFDFAIFRLIRRLDRIDGPSESIGRRLIPRVFEYSGLAASAP